MILISDVNLRIINYNLQFFDFYSLYDCLQEDRLLVHVLLNKLIKKNKKSRYEQILTVDENEIDNSVKIGSSNTIERR